MVDDNFEPPTNSPLVNNPDTERDHVLAKALQEQIYRENRRKEEDGCIIV